jgi:hypothetical protein
MEQGLIRSAIKLARDEKRKSEPSIREKLRFVVALLFKMR